MTTQNRILNAWLVGLSLTPVGVACGYMLANLQHATESIPAEVRAWDTQHANRLTEVATGSAKVASACEGSVTAHLHQFSAGGQTLVLPEIRSMYNPANCRS